MLSVVVVLVLTAAVVCCRRFVVVVSGFLLFVGLGSCSVALLAFVVSSVLLLLWFGFAVVGFCWLCCWFFCLSVPGAVQGLQASETIRRDRTSLAHL